MKKLIGLTGGKGTGKSQAAAYFARPSEIHEVLYFDTEDSTSDILRQLKENNLSFGTHVRMYERLLINSEEQDDILSSLSAGRVPWVGSGRKKASALADYFDYFTLRLNQATEEKKEDGTPKHRFLAIDTMGPILAGMVAMVEQNPSKFGWCGSTAYGKLEVEGVRPLWENLFEGCAQRGIEWIILTSHIKSVWHDKAPVLNKVKPGGRQKLLARLAALWFWVMIDPTNADGAPAALKLKGRLGQLGVTEDDWWEQRVVLPERIPHFTWKDVWGYLDNPADPTNPKPGERMSESERYMCSEFLNEAQMALMMVSAEATKFQAQAQMRGIPSAIPVAATKPEDNAAIVLEMLKENPDATPSEVSIRLGIPVPIAAGMLSAARK